ncbi:MAG: hypothetical protein GY847_05975 [Proteobacteria bacterium]|nr:hypothetical protein [Pseudomonadota bacterium]
MTTDSTKRIKRLISYREVERDKAGVDVSLSKVKRDRAKDAVNNAKQIVENELTEVTNQLDSPFSADDMQIAINCLRAAADEMTTREETLGNAESELNKKTRCLLAAHLRVKQMEVLQGILQKRRDKEIRSKEQREIDDLVTTREAIR